MTALKTYQDFQKEPDKLGFITQAINEYRSSEAYRVAVDADEYEAERNSTIMQWIRYIYNIAGQRVPDFTASNNKIACNFFHRLTTQRTAYSLGNGVSFANTTTETVDGKKKTVDKTKEALGKKFDRKIYLGAHYALIHGVCYLMWNLDHVEVFPMTEFVPLWDEDNGSLRAGIRFWSLDWEKRPITAVLYEEDGYTVYRTADGSRGLNLAVSEPKRGYIRNIQRTEIQGEIGSVEQNYSSLPIVPLWGSKHKQSELVGMKNKIDSYDLIRSGFANDLQECAEIYWILGNSLGETDESLAKFRDRIKLNHIAAVDTVNSSVTPYTQEIPTTARQAYLDGIKAQIYEDFGGLDVHTIAAGDTNDHINAAYQPLDEEADDFEYQVSDCIEGLLNLLGIEDEPIFKRNRISNEKETTEKVLMAANYLDRATVLKKLPWITVDEVDGILEAQDEEMNARLALEGDE